LLLALDRWQPYAFRVSFEYTTSDTTDFGGSGAATSLNLIVYNMIENFMTRAPARRPVTA
jgi:hypothetical protein